MPESKSTFKQFLLRNQIPLLTGCFLIGYWWFGFDGITFTDDVYYLLAGARFWEGSMVFSDYHFSTRWGAYIPSGFIGWLFGTDPHTVSAISLLSYLSTYFLLFKLTQGKQARIVLSTWFCLQIYFLHFLTKVYPDSILVFWVCLVPFVAVYRQQKGVLAGMALVLALFFGFLTKETIVFLAPFPILLFYFDFKSNQINWRFYTSILLTGIGLALVYLGYFWLEFGDPFYRVNSLQAGHYISEFTYADKSTWIMLKRLTILPFQTLVERAYWPWFVFALPGIAYAWKDKNSASFIFSLAFGSLVVGFWFMSTNLKFYNPIYLNPRHLIILIPLLAFLIASAWGKWQYNRVWETRILLLLGLGVLIAVLMQDWKMAAFNAVLAIPLGIKNQKLKLSALGILLLLPAIYSIYYQKSLKQYELLIENLQLESQVTDLKEPIFTHSFIDFSKEVLLPELPESQERIFPLYKFPSEPADFPKKLKVMIYDYYQHAYPDEQIDVDAITYWLNKNYKLIRMRKSGNISLYEYELN